MSNIIVKPLTRKALQDILQAGSAPLQEPPSTGVSQVIADLAEQLGADKTREPISQVVAENDAMAEMLGAPLGDAADRNTTADAVHKSAGSASVFRADDLVEHLRTLETVLRTDRMGEVAAAADEVQAAWTAIRSEMLAQRAGLDAEPGQTGTNAS